MLVGKSAQRSSSFRHFVDVSDMNSRVCDADPSELESRRKLIERLNSIDPETARIEVLTKKQFKVAKPHLLLSAGKRKRSSSEASASGIGQSDIGFNLCLDLLHNLLADPEVASVFGKPVTELWLPESIPGYLEAIEHPMDLDTVKRNLLRGAYTSDERTDVQAFSEDVRLVFENAMLYNEEYNVYYQLARVTLQKFDEAVPYLISMVEGNDLEADDEEDENDSTDHTEDERIHRDGKRSRVSLYDGDDDGCDVVEQDAQKDKCGPDLEQRCGGKPRSTSVGGGAESSSCSSWIEERGSRLSGPSGGDAVDILSYEQKKRLGESICRLSEAKLRKLIRLISLREGPAPVNTQHEIELDIDSLSMETLRDVQAFVRKCENDESGTGFSELSSSSAEDSNVYEDRNGADSGSDEEEAGEY
ncbi:Transcription factor GTE1 [Porphyridium purpureum]|uniref:Transcription factor GTE1 n=1 Tax=Porphyridium purpureum TaxID=35688 RepID=A0A5J4Z088_PORPP|nr:Transcription factor GTE1 [Porphyridium purpureum]|eukprot:POR4518..scf208_2